MFAHIVTARSNRAENVFLSGGVRLLIIIVSGVGIDGLVSAADAIVLADSSCHHCNFFIALRVVEALIRGPRDAVFSGLINYEDVTI